MNKKVYKLFDDIDGVYNYCPSPVCTDEETMHIFYCSNSWPEVIIDDIHTRQGKLADGKWIFEKKSCALSPSRTDWDCIHVCDPDVIKGEFNLNGEVYSWMMMYLGCDIHYCLHNQIGVAFAKEIDGPYVKYHMNPLVEYKEIFHWGAGQASMISMDGKGKIRMIYTKTIHNYETHILSSSAFWRDIDLSDANNPIIGEEVMIRTHGVINLDGDNKNVPIYNPTIVWDKQNDVYYVSTAGTPFDGKNVPDFITPCTQVLFISREDFENNEGGWKVVYTVDSKDTGFYRNHNAGLVKNSYGWLCNQKKLPIITTVSELNRDDFLWTYRLYYMEINLEDI